MKKTLKSIVLLSALCGGSLHASFEFRSPLSVQDRGYMHWLLAPADQAWWYGIMPSAKKNTAWNIHMWGAAYTRTADRAFFDACDSDKVTRDTTTLSQLFFGQTVFVGEDVFAGGTFAGAPTTTQALVNSVNPFLAFARIMPDFTYEEQGANMGIDFARYLGRNDRFHIGGRANIPFKIIEIEQDNSVAFEETLADVVATRIVNSDEGARPDQVEYAYRYDFLSTLVFDTVTIPSGNAAVAPVVRYNADGTIAITGVTVTGTTAAESDSVPAAYATKRLDGTVPVPPFKKAPSQITGPLGSDGQGTNDQTYFFQTGVDYANNLRNDRAAQATLFVVPRAIEAGLPSAGTLTPEAQAIRTNVTNIIEQDLLVSQVASTFFLDNGINLTAHERIVGIGDLATEIYGGIGHYDDWFVDGIFGIQFPTGKRQKHANQIFYKPTGNNGHVEIKLELDAGWKPRPWFAFEIRPAFVHACKRSEKRAAPFVGATVVNIGPEVELDVSWNYFVLRTDFSFFHPHNPDLGFTLGYELFVKGHDKVSLECQTTATDLLGRPNQPLAPCNYERNTNSLSNKLRGQIFHRWNYFEIFGGGTQMVSGRNIMKETEGHIGLAIYF
ncbi:MAG TPA: hypothetical protein VLB80_03545 [Candidatus Babeliales bacterium]|nr:hypothetical protein [Candidatus Babeliales bacterium]